MAPERAENLTAPRNMPDGSKLELFRRQKQLLDTFLKHGAISREQYDKSLGDLRDKMGIEE